MNIQFNKLQSKNRKLKLIAILIMGLLIIAIHSSLHIRTVKGVSETEAFFAISEAFEKVQEASRESVDVTDYIVRLNTALQHYNEGDYDTAYNLAVTVLEEVTENLSNIRWGKIFPYIIIPVNVVLVAAIVVFFGRNILGWFRKINNEIYLDLEIVYKEENNLEENQN